MPIKIRVKQGIMTISGTGTDHLKQHGGGNRVARHSFPVSSIASVSPEIVNSLMSLYIRINEKVITVPINKEEAESAFDEFTEAWIEGIETGGYAR